MTVSLPENDALVAAMGSPATQLCTVATGDLRTLRRHVRFTKQPQQFHHSIARKIGKGCDRPAGCPLGTV